MYHPMSVVVRLPRKPHILQLIRKAPASKVLFQKTSQETLYVIADKNTLGDKRNSASITQRLRSVKAGKSNQQNGEQEHHKREVGLF